MPNKLLTPNQTSPNQREMLLELDEEQTGMQMHVQVLVFTRFGFLVAAFSDDPLGTLVLQ